VDIVDSVIMKGSKSSNQELKTKPNILIILADDLGFSDIGCFGSEISTPNIDSLAQNTSNTKGMRFSQMYNCARCCPSRASLLTGVYPHQAGIGHMVYDAGVGPEYQGYLRKDVATIAELMNSRGYKTYMSGKWHVGGEYPPDASHVSKARDDYIPLLQSSYWFFLMNTSTRLIGPIMLMNLSTGMDTKHNGR
jgi:arylsulfatase A-like enzyme